LIGEENQGFKYIMHNFNHERWGFVVQANRFARVCYEVGPARYCCTSGAYTRFHFSST